MIHIALGAFGVAATAWLVTAAMRRYALSTHNFMDHPNSRSSHSVVTPRGGGVAIVFSFSALLSVLAWSGRLPPLLLLALLGSGLLVALVGFVDDLRSLPSRLRFLAHLVASVWALWCMDGIPSVPIFGTSVDLGWLGLGLATVWLLWMVSLYNFMDGIDGLAGIEAVTVALGGALCWCLATQTPYWIVPAALACSALGFLVWNYPPAKIFMGDAGSCFIGMVLAVLSLWTAQQATQVFWCWFILLGCFMVDATTTLVRRVRRGDKFSEAHRSHAYQYAARKHGSHKQVALAFGLANVLWLLPIAILVAVQRLDGVAGAIVAYLPLVWLAFRYKAGSRMDQEV